MHSVFKKPEKFDIELSVKIDPREFIVFVQLRPGCKEFLERMAEHYELVIYTASLRQYADPLMDILDP